MATAIENLQSVVAEQTTVIASAAALLGTLAEEIRQNAGDEAALNDLADRIDANTDSLAAAVEANTVPANEQPETPTDPTVDEGTGEPPIV